MVDTAHRLRVVSTEQVAALHFPTASGSVSSSCRTRLRHLVRAGLLHRAEPEQVRSEGRRPYLFMLTHDGVQLLVDELGYERENVDWRPSYNNAGSPFLRHQLAINDAYVAFRLGVERIGWRLTRWIDDRLLKKHHVDRVYVPDSARDVAVVPDAYFILEGPGGEPTLQFFLEIDRATMTVVGQSNRVKSWQDKIRAYQAYFTSSLITERYGTNRIRVMTVAPTEVRAESLRRATEDLGGKRRYWFASNDDVRPSTILQAPVWRIAGEEHAFVLVDRP